MARPLKRNADWFKHRADKAYQPHILALLRKHKAEGYGIMWLIKERISSSHNFRVRIEEDTLETWADEFRCSIEILESTINLLLIKGELGKSGKYLYDNELNDQFESLLKKRQRERYSNSEEDTFSSFLPKGNELRGKHGSKDIIDTDNSDIDIDNSDIDIDSAAAAGLSTLKTNHKGINKNKEKTVNVIDKQIINNDNRIIATDKKITKKFPNISNRENNGFSQNFTTHSSVVDTDNSIIDTDNPTEYIERDNILLNNTLSFKSGSSPQTPIEDNIVDMPIETTAAAAFLKNNVDDVINQIVTIREESLMAKKKPLKSRESLRGALHKAYRENPTELDRWVQEIDEINKKKSEKEKLQKTAEELRTEAEKLENRQKLVRSYLVKYEKITDLELKESLWKQSKSMVERKQDYPAFKTQIQEQIADLMIEYGY